MRTCSKNRGIFRAILAYILIFIFNFLSFFKPLDFFYYLIPFLLVFLPIVNRARINFSFSGSHFITGLGVSLAILLPYALIEIYTGKAFDAPTIRFIAIQLLGVAIPEEIFFRGYLQHTIGNNYKGILITSLLFSLAHLPVFFISNDIYPLLTFFPSIIIGFLYMKTVNIMPCIMFHFLSNILWAGFR